MRNFRKLVVATLAVILVFTSMPAALAADSAKIANADKAATLKDLGLYTGTDATDVAAGLDGALTTQDSLIFLAKLFGYNEAANALTADQVTSALAKFDDAASISDYAKNVVAYSATNDILAGSTQNGKFFVGAKDTVTSARFATFMLRQMGYTVADYKESVAKLAETKGSKVAATVTGDLTRDDAVGVMYGALNAEKASGKTVIVDIVGDDAALKEIAKKAGLLVESAPPSSGGLGVGQSVVVGDSSVALSVESVKILNNKQIEVNFNMEMNRDSAQNPANYSILDKGTDAKTLTPKSCKLESDRKTVTITLDNSVQDCLTNASKVKVVVRKGIMAMGLKPLAADARFEIEVQDGILPTVKGVAAIGEKNIRITFSEPVFEGGNNTNVLSNKNFAVKSGTYTYYIQKATLNLNTIDLEVGTKLIEGPVTLSINDAGLQENTVIQDYAGYKLFKGEQKFDYVKDISVPIVTVQSVRENEVVLHFSKPVKGSNVTLQYSPSPDANLIVAEATTEDYVEEITFSFDTLFSGGNLSFKLVNSSNEGEKLVDRYGIKAPDQTLSYRMAVDTTAPVVTQCIVNKDEGIQILFDEKLDRASATNPDNYEVINLSGNQDIFFGASLDASGKVVELRFENKLIDNTTYRIVIKNYKDVYGNKNTAEYSNTLTVSDYKNPEILLGDCFAVNKNGTIFISFSEPMNEYQMLDKANYRVKVDEWADLGDNDTLTKIDSRTVQIYVKALKDANDSSPAPSVMVAPIMDLANKRLNGSADAVEIPGIGASQINFKSIELIAKNKIKIEFSTQMDSIVDSDIIICSYNGDALPSLQIASRESTTVNAGGRTEVIYVLNGNLTTDGCGPDGFPITVKSSEAPASTSKWGSTLEPGLFILPKDKIAPEVVLWDHDSSAATADIPQVIGSGDIANSAGETVAADTTGTITIYFSEDIKQSNLALTTFNVSGFTITAIAAPTDSKTVVLTIQATVDNTSVHTTVTQVEAVYDKASPSNALSPAGTPWAVTLESKLKNFQSENG